MYKWHVHSALGRGRPVAGDVSRVTDGIAASLRQFSLSVSRSAEDGNGNDKPRFTISRRDPSPANGGAPRIPRSQRSANAVGEISSLASAKPRGIDARSLAAKPLTLRRVDRDAPPGAARGGGSFVSRGGGRGGLRGRGGAGVRGRGRGGARGRGKGNRRGGREAQRDGKEEDEDKEDEQPFTAEEQRAWDGGLGRRPYIPQTTLDSLLNHVPAVATSTSPANMTRTLVNSLQVMTGDRFEHSIMPEERSNMIHNGKGSMVWTEAERKTYAKAIPQIPEEHRNAILDAVLKGKHVAPKEAQNGDVMALAASYARRNETYLPGDAEKLEAKLKTLLPALKAKPAPAAETKAGKAAAV